MNYIAPVYTDVGMVGRPAPVRELRRWWALAKEAYLYRVGHAVTDRPPSRFPFSELQAVLDDYDDSTVFLHVGLSHVNAAFGERSYDRLYGELARQFDSVLVPGFTPSFRDSGVYHKRYSRPQVGMFPILFMDDADYRTDDAIHSIQVAGPYRFTDCDHHDTFGPGGCYAQLDRDNVLIANIGTNRLVSTQFHYVSFNTDPPYHEPETHSGVMYHDEESHEEIDQRNDRFTSYYSWNRWKMEEYLAERGVLDRRDKNGLKLSFFRAREMREAVEPKVDEQPYYMVA
jgi:aminoglycoside N3'-acetyltransferase